jgi:tetratricopeptide (TPR) repeat protein
MPKLKDQKVPRELFSLAEIHALLLQGEPRKALRRLLTQDGSLRAGHFGDRNHAWYCAGCAYFDLGEYERARSAFRKALRSDPSDVECLLAIGNCYDAEERPKLAERTFRRALALDPDSETEAKLYLNLANALFDQKRDSEAIVLYEKLKRRRDVVGDRARSNLVRVRRRLGESIRVVARKQSPLGD